jgi:2-polyprenyl-3-methyl-5-hydroxy-6-metoxy-1,4-benzoquinol methylase
MDADRSALAAWRLYYERDFATEEREWSAREPNRDEASRFAEIVKLLSEAAALAAAEESPFPGLRILDVGCGRGWLTYMAGAYGEANGIDPSPIAVEQARRNHPGTAFRTAVPGELLPTESGAYHLVVSSEVIEHVPPTQRDDFVVDLRRLLRPRGFVLLTSPRGELYGSWAANKKQPLGHWLKERELRELFVRHDFRPLARRRAYIDLPGLSWTSRLCASRGAGRAARAIRAEAILEALRFSRSIYQVWLFRLDGR